MMGDKSNQSTDLKMAGEDGYLTENYDTGTYISGSNSPNVSDSSSNISTETGQLNENTNNDLEHRKLIKNVKVSYQTTDFDTFISGMKSEINKYGGFVQDSNVNNDNSGKGYKAANITARIPAEQLDAFMSSASSLGAVVSISESLQDVTINYVDTQSYIAALRVEQESLMKLLEEASSLNDILTLQSKLTEVRQKLESYEKQLRTYDDLVAYCTVTMSITEVKTEEVIKVDTPFWEKVGDSFSKSMKSLGEGFKSFFIGFVGALPYLVTWLVIALIITGIILLIIRPDKRRKLKMKQEIENNNTDAEKVDNLNSSVDDIDVDSE